MSRQPEGKLKERIVSYLRGRGAFVFKVHGNEFQETGMTDLVCCWRGHFIGLELKLPGEEPSARQRHIIGQIVSAEGTAAVVHSVEDVERVLRRVARKGRIS